MAGYSERERRKYLGLDPCPRFGNKNSEKRKPWEPKGKLKAEREQHIRETIVSRGNMNIKKLMGE